MYISVIVSVSVITPLILLRSLFLLRTSAIPSKLVCTRFGVGSSLIVNH